VRARYAKWSIATSVAAALVIASYGLTTGSQSSAHAADPPQIVGEGAMSLPLDAYHLSALQSAERANEYNIVIRACMRNYGIAYQMNGMNVAARAANGFAVYDSRRYGVTDPTAVRAYGYHLPASVVPTNVSLQQSRPQLSRQQALVLTGSPGQKPLPASAFVTQTTKVGSYNGKSIPQGGCVGTAARDLHMTPSTSDDQKRNSLAANLQREDFLKTQSNPQVIAAFQAWSKCMAGHHYHYPNPIAAATNRAWNMKIPATRIEIQTATADIACKQQTNLVNIEYKVESSLQEASIKQHAAELSPLKALVTLQAEALQKTLAKYGS
jgi:hypothetical protein